MKPHDGFVGIPVRLVPAKLRPGLGICPSGDSTPVYDFSSATIDVRMSGIRDWHSPQSYPDLVWDGLDVRNGAFTDTCTIRGSFYGPNHEEVGGVFDRNRITGTFGAKRAQ